MIDKAVLNPETHSCWTCGYTWKHGRDGSHNCTSILKDRLNKCAANEWLDYPENKLEEGKEYIFEFIHEHYSNIEKLIFTYKSGYIIQDEKSYGMILKRFAEVKP